MTTLVLCKKEYKSSSWQGWEWGRMHFIIILLFKAWLGLAGCPGPSLCWWPAGKRLSPLWEPQPCTKNSDLQQHWQDHHPFYGNAGWWQGSWELACVNPGRGRAAGLPQFTPAEDGAARGGKVFPGFVSHHLPTEATKPFCGHCAAWKRNTVSV